MLSNLRLLNFRCFESCGLELGGRSALFVGQNAQGKTSLLEAVCLLLRLQSPRARTWQQVQKMGTASFGVSGEVGGRVLRVSAEAKELTLRVDGEEVSARRDYLARSAVVVWMGNEDLDLIRGGGESRRRYLDFLAMQVDADYAHHWQRYRRALMMRNRLLKTHRAGSAEVRSYTKLLVHHGRAMSEGRIALCEKITEHTRENHAAICGQVESIGLRYRDRAHGDLEAAFAKVEESETRRGVTLAGPHRDDLDLLVSERAAKDFASEGQQRTLALALKLAQGEILRERVGRAPVYLIDDVFGELDPLRRNALMSRLPSEAQKLITTTTLDWYEASGDDWLSYVVRQGEVSR